MRTKALIINGDDFGRSPQVNAGILRAHCQGMLTSASLMVAEPSCSEAVAAARDCPGLDVGLHLVACNGRSLLGLEGLVNDSGQFPASDVWAGLRYALWPGLCSKVRDEFRAQIERHLELVGHLYHINAHHNLHLHPDLADIVLELAAEYRIPWVRLVREPVLTTLSLAGNHWPRKLRDHYLFKCLSSRASRKMCRLGIRGNELTFGFHQTGHLTESYVLGVLAKLPEESLTEFYFHPAVEQDSQPPLWPSQSVETEILISAAVRAAILRHGIHLTTFREQAAIPGVRFEGATHVAR
ncbi:MAG: ChbG/HpnK family deacetylase [Terriglobia bacterium]